MIVRSTVVACDNSRFLLAFLNTVTPLKARVKDWSWHIIGGARQGGTWVVNVILMVVVQQVLLRGQTVQIGKVLEVVIRRRNEMRGDKSI